MYSAFWTDFYKQDAENFAALEYTELEYTELEFGDIVLRPIITILDTFHTCKHTQQVCIDSHIYVSVCPHINKIDQICAYISGPINPNSRIHYKHFSLEFNEIFFCSDLHIEFGGQRLTIESLIKREFFNGHDNYPEFKKNMIARMARGILVLAGDIGDPTADSYWDFIASMAEVFAHVIIIFGNHEYYYTQTVPESEDNVHFLNNSTININGITFAGSTLWGYITDPTNLCNDFNNGITVEMYNSWHNTAVEFINQLDPGAVLIVHHVPSRKLTHPKYAHINQQNYSTDDVHIWKHRLIIHGHTHTGHSTIINGVPIYCNPYGYPDERRGDYRLQSVIVGNQSE